MLTLAELLAPITATEAEAEILSALDGFGFPATSWQTKSVPRTLVKWFATKYASVTQTIGFIARGGFLSTAAALQNTDGTDDPDWLNLCVESQYDEERNPATTTVGKIVLTNTSGSPYVIAIGQLWVTAPLGLRFNNTSAGTLAAPDGSTLTLDWQAESPGSAYNIANESDLELATPLPGVTVANPAYLSTGTWITTAGSAAESNADFAARARAKWVTLGTGGAAQAYSAWALEGAPTVTRVLVDDANPDGPGTIRVYLANAAGAATGAEILAADAYIQDRRALTASVTTLAASPVTITVTATIYVLAAYATIAPGEAAANVTAYAAALGIGETLYVSEILTALSDPVGVRNATVTTPSADVSIDPSEVVTITLDVTTVIV